MAHLKKSNVWLFTNIGGSNHDDATFANPLQAEENLFGHWKWVSLVEISGSSHNDDLR